MLVTFTSKTYADITLFGDIAMQLLQMMGHSATVPGSILAEDIPAALASLKQALSQQAADEQSPSSTQDDEQDEDEDEEPLVGLQRRAYPLIQLLEAAEHAASDVMWRETGS